VRGFCDQGDESDFCAQHEVSEPIKAWTPTIAPSGTDYYNAEGIPQFKNSLLVALLKGSKLLQLKLSDDGSAIVQENEFLSDKYGRLRDICVSPQGNIYVCTSNGTDDKIIELTGVVK
jgi:glucose/arabinose dehydrogenase